MQSFTRTFTGYSKDGFRDAVSDAYNQLNTSVENAKQHQINVLSATPLALQYVGSTEYWFVLTAEITMWD